MAAEEGKTFIGPDEGAYLPVLDITHKVTARASGGSLTIEEWGLPPGMMIPPHTHDREDECDFVLEGELKCDVGGEVVLAPAGSYVLKPRDVAHAFYNAGPETVRVLGIVTPGGLEGYFDQYEQIASKLVSGEIDEGEHRRSRARRALWDHLARRAHPRGQGPFRHRPLATRDTDRSPRPVGLGDFLPAPYARVPAGAVSKNLRRRSLLTIRRVMEA